MAKNNLLFIAHTDNLAGGGEANLLGLIVAAKKRGFINHLVVPSIGEFSAAAKASCQSVTAFKYYYWGEPHASNKSLSDLVAISRITEVIKEKRVDCVVTNTLMIPWGALASALTNTPHVWIASEFLEARPENITDHYDFVEDFSNLVMADSKNNADYLKKKIGFANAKFFRAFIDTSEIRLLKPSRKPRLICIGSILPVKNQLELLRALLIIRKKLGYQPEVLFIGPEHTDERYLKELKNFINKNDIKNVTFTGYNPNPFKLIAQNDILIQTSIAESLSHVVIEAMKLGVNLIASDTPSTEEAFALGGGLMYKRGNYSELAKQIINVLEDQKTYQIKAEKIKKRAHESLSEKRCNDLFFNEIKKITNQQNPQKQIRHILPYISLAIVEHELNIKRRDTKIDELEKLIKRLNNDIENIVNSKSWKAVLTARKILRR